MQECPAEKKPKWADGWVRTLKDVGVGKVPADSLQRTGPETPALPCPLWAGLGETALQEPAGCWPGLESRFLGIPADKDLFASADDVSASSFSSHPLLCVSPFSIQCLMTTLTSSLVGTGVTFVCDRWRLTQGHRAGIRRSQEDIITPKSICPQRPWDFHSSTLPLSKQRIPLLVL